MLPHNTHQSTLILDHWANSPLCSYTQLHSLSCRLNSADYNFLMTRYPLAFCFQCKPFLSFAKSERWQSVLNITFAFLYTLVLYLKRGNWINRWTFISFAYKHISSAVSSGEIIVLTSPGRLLGYVSSHAGAQAVINCVTRTSSY